MNHLRSWISTGDPLVKISVLFFLMAGTRIFLSASSSCLPDDSPLASLRLESICVATLWACLPMGLDVGLDIFFNGVAVDGYFRPVLLLSKASKAVVVLLLAKFLTINSYTIMTQCIYVYYFGSLFHFCKASNPSPERNFWINCSHLFLLMVFLIRLISNRVTVYFYGELLLSHLSLAYYGFTCLLKVFRFSEEESSSVWNQVSDLEFLSGLYSSISFITVLVIWAVPFVFKFLSSPLSMRDAMLFRHYLNILLCALSTIVPGTFQLI
jgi:hypothetical protein